MKKRYILIPLACVLALVVIVVAIAIALKASYLEKLSYDHVSENVYNNVEVVGDEGLFYLVKDGKKASDGYVSLKSVNDYYEPSVIALHSAGKQVVIYDYYLAREAENPNYILIDSSGDKYIIMGENYTLSDVKLPYLIFVNNVNGREAAISLNRLDSDISYKSGSELTLLPFKNVTPCKTSDDSASALYSYLLTDDVADTPQQSCFRSDGIKIMSGELINRVELFRKNSVDPSVFFYDSDAGSIFSMNGDLIASDIIATFSPNGEWCYAICHDEDEDTFRVVAFTSEKTHTLISEKYNIAKFDTDLLSYVYGVKHFGNCLVLDLADASGVEVINVETGNKAFYLEASVGTQMITVKNAEDSYSYLDRNGAVIMSGKYGDMVSVPALCTSNCTVLESATYNTEAGAEYLHFVRAGAEIYTLKLDGFAKENINYISDSCYTVVEQDEGVLKYTLLAPFSSIKMSDAYDSVKWYSFNQVSFILAADYDGQKYDIVDPITAKAVSTVACAPEDFAKYEFTHDGNIALATDRYDTETTVPMTVLKLTKYDNDDLINHTRYFVLYRSATYRSINYNNAHLQCTEIGKNLLDPTNEDSSAQPYVAITAENYLIAYSSSGSEMFSLDDTNALTVTATIPYQVDNIITDRSDSSVRYFRVKNDTGLYGLYDTDSQAVLAPYYSNIVSVENGYFVVSQKGAMGVIRLKGKEIKKVIDFSYFNVLPLGDHGYLAISREGDIDVYSDNESMLPQQVQSWSFINCYSTDEDGVLSHTVWPLISAGGNYYIHRSSTVLNGAVNTFSSESMPDIELPLNQRARVIYYYNGEDAVHTDVIYPNTVVYELITAPNELGWYTAKAEDRQIVPVDVGTVLALDGHFIRLYAKQMPIETETTEGSGTEA